MVTLVSSDEKATGRMKIASRTSAPNAVAIPMASLTGRVKAIRVCSVGA